MKNKVADRLSKPDLTKSQKNAVDFFNSVHQSFKKSEQAASDTSQHFYWIGDYPVCLRFAGSALVRLITPALEHLQCQPVSDPALTICIWESDQSGLEKPPAPPWSWDDYIVRGEVHGYNDDRIHTAFHVNTLSMLDANLNIGIYWVRDVSGLPYYESGSPLLRVLHWWMRKHGRQLIHAASVGTKEGGVLLAGKGGSGKSTTALFSFNSDLLYCADDYCLVAAHPKPYVYSVFSSGKVDSKDLERFPFLKPALSNVDHLSLQKALYFLYKHFPEKISTGFPIRAILLPRVTGSLETKLKKIPSSAGLLALAPSTIFQLPGAGNEAFKMLSELVKKTPSYILEAGTDLAQVSSAIFDLLSEINSRHISR